MENRYDEIEGQLDKIEGLLSGLLFSRVYENDKRSGTIRSKAAKEFLKIGRARSYLAKARAVTPSPNQDSFANGYYCGLMAALALDDYNALSSRVKLDTRRLIKKAVEEAYESNDGKPTMDHVFYELCELGCRLVSKNAERRADLKNREYGRESNQEKDSIKFENGQVLKKDSVSEMVRKWGYLDRAFENRLLDELSIKHDHERLIREALTAASSDIDPAPPVESIIRELMLLGCRKQAETTVFPNGMKLSSEQIGDFLNRLLAYRLPKNLDDVETVPLSELLSKVSEFSKDKESMEKGDK